MSEKEEIPIQNPLLNSELKGGGSGLSKITLEEPIYQESQSVLKSARDLKDPKKNQIISEDAQQKSLEKYTYAENCLENLIQDKFQGKNQEIQKELGKIQFEKGEYLEKLKKYWEAEEEYEKAEKNQYQCKNALKRVKQALLEEKGKLYQSIEKPVIEIFKRNYFAYIEYICANITQVESDEVYRQTMLNFKWLQQNYEVLCQPKVVSDLHSQYDKCIEKLVTAFEKAMDMGQYTISYYTADLLNQILQSLVIHFLEDKSKMRIDRKIWEAYENRLQIIEKSIIKKEEKDSNSQLPQGNIEYQLFLIKMGIQLVPGSDEDLKNDLIQLFKGAVKAVLTSSSNQDLITGLIAVGKAALKKGRQTINGPIYKKIYQIAFYKRIILKKMDNPLQNLKEIQSFLNQITEVLLEGDQHWAVQYSWIQAMCDIIIHKPLVTLQQIQKGLNIPNESVARTLWKQLLKNEWVIEFAKEKNTISEIKREGKINNIFKNSTSFTYFQEAKDYLLKEISMGKEIRTYILLGGLFQEKKFKGLLSYVDFEQKSLFGDDSWRIRESVILACFRLSGQLSSEQDGDIKEQVEKEITQRNVKETHLRVKQTLKNKENLKEMLDILQRNWKSQEQEIKQYIQNQLDELTELQNSIKMEEDEEKRQQLLEEYKLKEDDLNEQIDNITGVGNQLGIAIEFMKSMKKDLVRIEGKIDEIKDSLNDMQMDLKSLRGKTVKQLLEIRKKNIFHWQQIIELRSVYVDLLTKERKVKENQDEIVQTKLLTYEEEPENSQLDRDKIGEINEFIHININQDSKDSMLIHGGAGSGKSTTARKVEEYLWMLYQQKLEKGEWKWEENPQEATQKDNENETPEAVDNQSPLVPIMVSLPSLKNPLDDAIKETLRSDAYRFDSRQIDELKTAVQEGQIRIVLILDSYDELKGEYIGQNLYKSNKLQKWGKNGSNSEGYPKVITTTRTEILTDGYQLWFVSQQEDKLKAVDRYKEIKIIPFSSEQKEEYLKQYVKISIKRVLLDMYQAISGLNENKILDDFVKFWEKLNQNDKISQIQDKQGKLVERKESQIIIQCLKNDGKIPRLSVEQDRTIKVLLQELWSFNKFQQTIEKIDLDSILETPFMMEIVVQVLPEMLEKEKNPVKLKEKLVKEFSSKGEMYWEKLEESKEFMQTFSMVQTEKELQTVIKSVLTDLKQQDLEKIQKALQKHNLTKYDFYETFMGFYYQGQINKMMDQGQEGINFETFSNDLKEFGRNLALDMTKRELTQVNYEAGSQFYEKKETWEDQYFKQGNDTKSKIRKFLRQGIPIKQKGGSYSFNHKSIQEFLVAKDFYDALEKLNENFNKDFVLSLLETYYTEKGKENARRRNSTMNNNMNDMHYQQIQLMYKVIVLKEQNINKKATIWDIIQQEKDENIQKMIEKDEEIKSKDQQEVKKTLQQQFTSILDSIRIIQEHSINQDSYFTPFKKGVLNFIKEKVNTNQKMKNLLLLIVKLTKIDPDFLKAASNSISILNFLGQSFANEDLQGIKIEGAYLRNGDFFNANLKNSSLKSTDLNCCNLSMCNLQEADLQGVQVGGYLDLMSFGGIKFSRFSSNGKYVLLVGFPEYNIREKGEWISIYRTGDGKRVDIKSEDKESIRFNQYHVKKTPTFINFQGDLIYLASKTYFIIINMSNGQIEKEIKNLDGNERIMHVFFMQKKEKYYLIRGDNAITELDISNNNNELNFQEIGKIQLKNVQQFIPYNSKEFYLVSKKGQVELYNIEENKSKIASRFKKGSTLVIPEGSTDKEDQDSYIAEYYGNTLNVYDYPMSEEDRELYVSPFKILSVTKDAKCIITQTENGEFTMFNNLDASNQSQYKRKEIYGCSENIDDFKSFFSEDGSFLAFVSPKKDIRFYNIIFQSRQGKSFSHQDFEGKKSTKSAISLIIFDSFQKRRATLSEKGTVRLWNYEGEEVYKDKLISIENSKINYIYFLDQGKKLVAQYNINNNINDDDNNDDDNNNQDEGQGIAVFQLLEDDFQEISKQDYKGDQVSLQYSESKNLVAAKETRYFLQQNVDKSCQNDTVLVSPSFSQYLIINSQKNAINLIHSLSEQSIFKASFTNNIIKECMFSQDGDFLLVQIGEENRQGIEVYRTKTGKKLANLEQLSEQKHKFDILKFAEGNLLILEKQNKQKPVQVYKIDQEKATEFIENQAILDQDFINSILNFSFFPDISTLVLQGEKSLKITKINSEKTLNLLQENTQEQNYHSASIEPYMRRFIMLYEKQNIGFLNVETMKKQKIPSNCNSEPSILQTQGSNLLLLHFEKENKLCMALMGKRRRFVYQIEYRFINLPQNQPQILGIYCKASTRYGEQCIILNYTNQENNQNINEVLLVPCFDFSQPFDEDLIACFETGDSAQFSRKKILKKAYDIEKCLGFKDQVSSKQAFLLLPGENKMAYQEKYTGKIDQLKQYREIMIQESIQIGGKHNQISQNSRYCFDDSRDLNNVLFYDDKKFSIKCMEFPYLGNKKEQNEENFYISEQIVSDLHSQLETVTICNLLKESQEIIQLQTDETATVVFSPIDKCVVMQSNQGKLAVYDVDKQKIKEIPQKQNQRTQVKFSENGDKFACFAQDLSFLEVYDEIGEEISIFELNLNIDFPKIFFTVQSGQFRILLHIFKHPLIEFYKEKQQNQIKQLEIKDSDFSFSSVKDIHINQDTNQITILLDKSVKFYEIQQQLIQFQEEDNNNMQQSKKNENQPTKQFSSYCFQDQLDFSQDLADFDQVSFYNNCKTLLLKSESGQIKSMYDLQAKERIAEFLYGHKQEIKSVQYSPQNGYIISKDQSGIIKVWSQTYEQKGLNTTIKITQHQKISDFKISSNDLRIILLSDQNEVFLYDLNTLKQIEGDLKTAKNVQYMNFSNDGSKIAIIQTKPDCLKIFNGKDGSQIGEDIQLQSSKNQAIFSHDNKQIATYYTEGHDVQVFKATSTNQVFTNQQTGNQKQKLLDTKVFFFEKEKANIVSTQIFQEEQENKESEYQLYAKMRVWNAKKNFTESSQEPLAVVPVQGLNSIASQFHSYAVIVDKNCIQLFHSKVSSQRQKRFQMHDYYMIKSYQGPSYNYTFAVLFHNDLGFLRIYDSLKLVTIQDIHIQGEITCYKIVQKDRKYENKRPVEEVCIADDRGFLHIYDIMLKKKRNLQRLHQTKILFMDYCKEANQLATACKQGYITVIDLTNYSIIKKIFTGHTSEITYFGFSEQEKNKLFQADNSGIISLWGFNPKENNMELYIDTGLHQLQFLTDNFQQNSLFLGNQNTFVKYSLQNSKQKENEIKVFHKSAISVHKRVKLQEENEDSFVVATGCWTEERVLLWEKGEIKQVLSGTTTGQNRVDFIGFFKKESQVFLYYGTSSSITNENTGISVLYIYQYMKETDKFDQISKEEFPEIIKNQYFIKQNQHILLEFRDNFQLYQLIEKIELKKEIKKKNLACPMEVNLELNTLTMLRNDFKNQKQIVKVFHLSPNQSDLDKPKPYKAEEYTIPADSKTETTLIKSQQNQTNKDIHQYILRKNCHLEQYSKGKNLSKNNNDNEMDQISFCGQNRSKILGYSTEDSTFLSVFDSDNLENELSIGLEKIFKSNEKLHKISKEGKKEVYMLEKIHKLVYIFSEERILLCIDLQSILTENYQEFQKRSTKFDLDDKFHSQIVQFPSEQLISLEFNQEEDTMIIQFQDIPYIMIYNTQDFQLEKKLLYKQPWNISQMRVSSDQKYLAVGYKDQDNNSPYRIINIYKKEQENEQNWEKHHQQILLSQEDYQGIQQLQLTQLEFDTNSEHIITLYSQNEEKENSLIFILDIENANITKTIQTKQQIRRFYSLYESNLLFLESLENQILVYNLESNDYTGQEYKLTSTIQTLELDQGLAIFKLENSNYFIYDTKIQDQLLKEACNIQISNRIDQNQTRIIAFQQNNNINIIQLNQQEKTQICSIEKEENSITSFKLSQNASYLAIFQQEQAQILIYDLFSQTEQEEQDGNQQGKLIQTIQLEKEEIQDEGEEEKEDKDKKKNNNKVLEYEFFNTEESTQEMKIMVHTIKNNQISLYSITENQQIQPILKHQGQQIQGITYCPLKNLFASSSKQGEISITEGQKGKKIASFKGQSTENKTVLQFSPNGNLLFQSSSSPDFITIQIWDIKTKQPKSKLELDQQQQEQNLNNIIFSPCGTRFITLQTYNTQIWDLETFQKVGEPFKTEKNQELKALGFTSDQKQYSIYMKTDSQEQNSMDIVSINLEDGSVSEQRKSFQYNEEDESNTITSIKSGKNSTDLVIQQLYRGFNLVDMTKTEKEQEKEIVIKEGFETEITKQIMISDNGDYFVGTTYQDSFAFYSMTKKEKIGLKLRSVEDSKNYKYSKNGRFLAFQSSYNLQIWDIQDNFQVVEPISLKGNEPEFKFSQNSSLLVLYFKKEYIIVSTKHNKILFKSEFQNEIKNVIISPCSLYLLFEFKEENHYSLFDIQIETINNIQILQQEEQEKEEKPVQVVLQFVKLKEKLFILEGKGANLSYFEVTGDLEKEQNKTQVNLSLEESDFITKIDIVNEVFIYIETEENVVKIIDFSQKSQENQCKILIDILDNNENPNKIITSSKNLDYCVIVYQKEVLLYDNYALSREYSDPQIKKILDASISEKDNILYLIALSQENDYILLKLGKNEPEIITNFTEKPENPDNLPQILLEPQGAHLFIEEPTLIKIFDCSTDMRKNLPKVYYKKEKVKCLNVFNGLLYIQYRYFTEIYDFKQNKTEKVFLPMHSSNINMMKFTPDSKQLLTGSQDKTVIVWDCEKAKAIQQLKGFQDQISFIEISMDSKIALIGDQKGRNSVWDIQKGEKLYSYILDIESSVRQICEAKFSKNNEFCMTLDKQNNMKLWNLKQYNDQKEHSFEQQQFKEIAINQTYKQLISVNSIDRNILLFSLDNGEQILNIDSSFTDSDINLKSFRNNERYSLVYQNSNLNKVISEGLSYFLAIIDHQKEKIAYQFVGEGHILNIESNEDQNIVFINYRNCIQIFNLNIESQEELDTSQFIRMPQELENEIQQKHKQSIFSLSNEDMILTTQVFQSHLSHFNLKENKKCILPIQENQSKVEQFGLENNITLTEISLYSNKLAIAADKKLLIFDLLSFQAITSIENSNNSIEAIKFHPQEDILAISQCDGSLVLMKNKTIMKQHLNKGFEKNKRSVIEYSSDGQLIGHAYGLRVDIYDIKGTQLYTIILEGEIIAFKFSKNNQTLAISHNINTNSPKNKCCVSLVDIKTQKINFVFTDTRTANLLAFEKQEENTLIIGRQQQRQLEKWDLNSGHLVNKEVTRDPSKHEKFVLSPDHEYFCQCIYGPQSLYIQNLKPKSEQILIKLRNFNDYQVENFDFKIPNMISTIRKYQQKSQQNYYDTENIADLWVIEQSKSIYQQRYLTCQSVCFKKENDSKNKNQEEEKEKEKEKAIVKDFRVVWGGTSGYFTVIDGKKGEKEGDAFDLEVKMSRGYEGNMQDICINQKDCDSVTCSTSAGRVYVTQKYSKLDLILKFISEENVQKLKELGVIKGDTKENYELDNEKYEKLEKDSQIPKDLQDIWKDIMSRSQWIVIKSINLNNNQEQPSLSALMANIEGAKMTSEVRSAFMQKEALGQPQTLD